MRWIGVALLCLALAACGSGASKPHAAAKATTFSARGTMTVPADESFLERDQTNIFIGAPCKASADDIAAGTQVVVEDEAGKTVALGSLGGGSLFGKVGTPEFELQCRFAFAVAGVPSGHPFYRVGVGRRGTEQYTATQMHAPIRLALA